MSALSSPLDLRGAVDEAHELHQGDCKGCGAPLCAGTERCAYCDRQTPYGARRARLDRLAARDSLLGPGLQGQRGVRFNDKAYLWVKEVGR